jgi:hypothetical protein
MRTGLRLLLLVLVAPSIVHAQQGASLNDKLTNIFIRMGSKDLGSRQAASSELGDIESEGTDPNQYQGEPGIPAFRNVLDGFFARHPDQAERVKLAWIHLLETEIRASRSRQVGSGTEDYGEYLFGVTMTVSALRDDRAIPALASAINWSGVDLLQYGDKALGPVIDQLRGSPDALVRSRSLQVAAIILEMKEDKARRRRVEQLILSSIKDKDAVVRRTATSEISCLDNRQEYVPMLEQIAKTDPTKLSGRALDGGDGNEFYPVRYTARRILRGIQENKPCEH